MVAQVDSGAQFGYVPVQNVVEPQGKPRQRRKVQGWGNRVMTDPASKFPSPWVDIAKAHISGSLSAGRVAVSWKARLWHRSTRSRVHLLPQLFILVAPDTDFEHVQVMLTAVDVSVFLY